LNRVAFVSFAMANPGIKFVFVNDGSTDATLDVLHQMQRAVPQQIEVFSLAQNSGKAEAVRRGLQHVSSRGDELIAYWDADLATPLDAVFDFVNIAEKMPHINVVYGARLNLMGHEVNRDTSRRIISKCCNILARAAVRLPIGDTQCGSKLLRNTPELRAAIAKPFTSGWMFDIELFARMARMFDKPQKAFYEQPLMAWEEVAGSKIKKSTVIKCALDVVRIIAEDRGLMPKKRVRAMPAIRTQAA
jgi:glycosyltransferase involved in cell wall biosynthesis